MFTIQLLLPLFDNSGNRFPTSLYSQVRNELVSRFGGLTIYTRAPVDGLWQESDGETRGDELIIVEVMSDQLDRSWWHAYRMTLEQKFVQDTLVVRAHEIEML